VDNFDANANAFSFDWGEGLGWLRSFCWSL